MTGRYVVVHCLEASNYMHVRGRHLPIAMIPCPSTAYSDRDSYISSAYARETEDAQDLQASRASFFFSDFSFFVFSLLRSFFFFSYARVLV